MASLFELASGETTLGAEEIEHLARLVASWSLLADLAFSDLLLVVPRDRPQPPDELVVLSQVRPNNRATVVGDDLVGVSLASAQWPQVSEALRRGELLEGTATVAGGEALPAWFIPVGYRGRSIAVVVRLESPSRGPKSDYEPGYLNLFRRLCAMVVASSFPFREADVAGPGLPRVGDGVILVNAQGVVDVVTPNATNALHRLGLYDEPEGCRLDEYGLGLRALDRALDFGLPAVEEVDRGQDVAILVHCVPLLDGSAVSGAVVLLRDVSDVRQLDRVVLHKDQAIKEVHHRIKNNLQTISSLLRLQARRSDDPHSAHALLEAERRVRSIALVHEVLSREPGQDVAFKEIVASLVGMVEDSVLADLPVEITVEGDLGLLRSEVATPIAVVLAELLTNAVEHAFADRGSPGGKEFGLVTLRLSARDGEAVAEIRDNGRGLDPRFRLEDTDSLGLSIVRDLVRSQLGGTIEMRSLGGPEGGGTNVVVRVPLAPA